MRTILYESTESQGRTTYSELLNTLMLHKTIGYSNGTLVENYFCELQGNSKNDTPRILLDKFLDHRPYFSSIEEILTNILNLIDTQL